MDKDYKNNNSVSKMNRAYDWLEQAKNDLEAAKNLMKAGNYNWVCFLCQQAAEKSLKSLSEALNIPAWGHDLNDLLDNLKQKINIPDEIINLSSVLNLYYITTRYPDVFTTGFPAQKFTEYQGREAIRMAEVILDFASKKIKDIK